MQNTTPSVMFLLICLFVRSFSNEGGVNCIQNVLNEVPFLTFTEFFCFHVADAFIAQGVTHTLLILLVLTNCFYCLQNAMYC